MKTRLFSGPTVNLPFDIPIESWLIDFYPLVVDFHGGVPSDQPVGKWLASDSQFMDYDHVQFLETSAAYIYMLYYIYIYMLYYIYIYIIYIYNIQYNIYIYDDISPT